MTCSVTRFVSEDTRQKFSKHTFQTKTCNDEARSYYNVSFDLKKIIGIRFPLLPGLKIESVTL